MIGARLPACYPCSPEGCCDAVYPDLEAYTVYQWSPCEGAYDEFDQTPPADGAEIARIEDLNGVIVNLIPNPGSPGSLYSAESTDSCPLVCTPSSPSKGAGLDGLYYELAGTCGVAVIWTPPAGPYTLLIPQGLSANEVWFVFDDEVNLHVVNGDNSIAYSTAAPTRGERHLLELVADESTPASSIRLDMVDITPPGALWGSAVGLLGLANLDLSGGSGVTVCWEWCAFWPVNNSPLINVESITPDNGLDTSETPFEIFGWGFTGATSVTLAGVEVLEFTVVDDETITGTSSMGAPGNGDVVVTTPIAVGTLTGGWTYTQVN